MFILVIENDITAKKFKLRSFESWSLDLNLTDMERNDLQALLGMPCISDSFVTAVTKLMTVMHTLYDGGCLCYKINFKPNTMHFQLLII